MAFLCTSEVRNGVKRLLNSSALTGTSIRSCVWVCVCGVFVCVAQEARRTVVIGELSHGHWQIENHFMLNHFLYIDILLSSVCLSNTSHYAQTIIVSAAVQYGTSALKLFAAS